MDFLETITNALGGRKVADSQCNAVYAWEDRWESWNRASASERRVRAAIRRAERLYKIRPTKILTVVKDRTNHRTDERNGRGLKLASEYDPVPHTIKLRPRHMNLAVALHEAAHAIHDELFGNISRPELESHGPMWLGIYLWLLVDAKVAPKFALLGSAQEAGLEWRPMSRVQPRKIRAAYSKLIRTAEFWTPGP